MDFLVFLVCIHLGHLSLAQDHGVCLFPFCWCFLLSAPQSVRSFFSFFLWFSQAITAVAAENEAFGAATEEEVEGIPFFFHWCSFFPSVFFFNYPPSVSPVLCVFFSFSLSFSFLLCSPLFSVSFSSPFFFLPPIFGPFSGFYSQKMHAFSLIIKTFKTVIAGVMVTVGDGRGVRFFSDFIAE